jgi:hypothetical protein
MKKTVNENARMAANTIWMILYAKSNDCILWIHLLQNQRQWSVNNFRSCKSGNWKFNWLWWCITEALATCIGKNDSDMLHSSSCKWTSMECQRLLVLRPELSHHRYIAGSYKRIIGLLCRQHRLQYPPCPIWKMSVNGGSTIIGHVFCVIWAVTGCKQSSTKCLLPL